MIFYVFPHVFLFFIILFYNFGGLLISIVFIFIVIIFQQYFNIVNALTFKISDLIADSFISSAFFFLIPSVSSSISLALKMLENLFYLIYVLVMFYYYNKLCICYYYIFPHCWLPTNSLVFLG